MPLEIINGVEGAVLTPMSRILGSATLTGRSDGFDVRSMRMNQGTRKVRGARHQKAGLKRKDGEFAGGDRKGEQAAHVDKGRAEEERPGAAG